MKTLTESWSEFLAAVYPEGLPPNMLIQARKCFFAGALTSLKLAMRGKDEFKAVFVEAQTVCEHEIRVAKTKIKKVNFKNNEPESSKS